MSSINAPSPAIALGNETKDASPVRRQLRNIFLFFWSPAELFGRLRSRPDWFIAFLLISILTMLATLAMQPFTMRVAQLSAPAGMSPEKVDQFISQVRLVQYVGVALVPVGLLIKCALSAVLLSTLMVLFTGNGSFKINFCLFNHIAMITVIQTAVSLIVLGLRGMDGIRGPLDLRVAMGLNLIIQSDNIALDAVLNSISVLDIWFLIAIIIAVRSLVKCSRTQAAIAGASYWLLTAALQVGLVVVGNHSVAAK
jgi:hypothetical protein